MYGKRYFDLVQQILLLIMLSAMVLLLTWPRLHPPAEQSISISADTSNSLAVTAQAGNDFGKLYISTDDDLQLGSAYVLINGERAGNFANGDVTVRVYPGDVVELDGSRYQRSIHFSVQALSSSIDSSYLFAAPTTQSDIVRAGIIVFH